tara:strand:+ start:162 stop:1046 length:885 start_codon:yes stop_codon:yes gene_type:complete
MMNIALKITIKKLLLLITLIELGFFSVFGYSSEQSEPKDVIPPESLLQFQTFAETEQDENLLRTLEEANTFNRIKKFINTNFVLGVPIRFHIQHPKESKLIATELDKQSHVVNLPFSFLHTLHQGLTNKYEYQPEVINTIFSASTEYYIWSEFAEYLIDNKQLDVEGDIFAATDNLATIIMLNQNDSSSDYIADASEAYLLIHSTKSSTINQQAQSELQLDQQRYKHIICLSIGFDQIIQIPNYEKLHLNSFSWDERKIEKCKDSYSLIMRNWHHAIKPSLQKNSIIHHWLNQL